MLNHDARLAVPTVFIADADNTADGNVYAVATQRHKAGQPVYNSYGLLSPMMMLENYGFVDPGAAFVGAPGLSAVFKGRDSTSPHKACTEGSQLFYGKGAKAVTVEGTLPAELGMVKGEPIKQGQTHRPGRPLRSTLECAQVYVSSRLGRATRDCDNF